MDRNKSQSNSLFITSLMMSDGPIGTQFLSLDALSTCIFASQYSPPDRFLFFPLLHLDMQSVSGYVSSHPNRYTLRERINLRLKLVLSLRYINSPLNTVVPPCFNPFFLQT